MYWLKGCLLVLKKNARQIVQSGPVGKRSWSAPSRINNKIISKHIFASYYSSPTLYLLS